MTQAAGVLSELYTVHYRPAARRHGYQSSIKHIYLSNTRGNNS